MSSFVDDRARALCAKFGDHRRGWREKGKKLFQAANALVNLHIQQQYAEGRHLDDVCGEDDFAEVYSAQVFRETSAKARSLQALRDELEVLFAEMQRNINELERLCDDAANANNDSGQGPDGVSAPREALGMCSLAQLAETGHQLLSLYAQDLVMKTLVVQDLCSGSARLEAMRIQLSALLLPPCLGAAEEQLWAVLDACAQAQKGSGSDDR